MKMSSGLSSNRVATSFGKILMALLLATPAVTLAYGAECAGKTVAECADFMVQKVGELMAANENLSARVATLDAQIKQLQTDLANMPATLAPLFEFTAHAGARAFPNQDSTADCEGSGTLVGGSCVGFNGTPQIAIGPVFYDPQEQNSSKVITTIRCEPAGNLPRAVAICMRLRNK
jgi:cell division protein FtsB